MNDMGLRSLLGFKVRGVPLFAVCLCGLAGVLVDADHIIAYHTGLDGRFLHVPFLIISVIMLCLIRRPLVVALCCAVIAHMVQDYTLNWF